MSGRTTDDSVPRSAPAGLTNPADQIRHPPAPSRGDFHLEFCFYSPFEGGAGDVWASWRMTSQERLCPETDSSPVSFPVNIIREIAFGRAGQFPYSGE